MSGTSSSLSGAGTAGSSPARGRVYTLREDVVRLALAQQGRIEYLWGGKYNNLGRSPFWGFPQQNENGEIFTDGLDCSGFVTWVLLNAAGTVEALPTIGEGRARVLRAKR